MRPIVDENKSFSERRASVTKGHYDKDSLRARLMFNAAPRLEFAEAETDIASDLIRSVSSAYLLSCARSRRSRLKKTDRKLIPSSSAHRGPSKRRKSSC